ncbi:MAG: fimbrillin family protein [Bacteroidales bacterium]
MKKEYTFKQAVIGIVLFLMASCTCNDLLNEYEFSTTSINFTQNEISALKSKSSTPLNGFSVFAYHTGTESFEDFLSSGKILIANWMYDQKVIRNIQGVYTYSPLTYWPLDPQHKISFISYAPVESDNIDIISPDAISKTGAPVFKYTTNIENPTEDFMVSQPVCDLNRQNGSVKFHMLHVLSKLQFNIKSTGNNIRIKSIGLKHVYTGATYHSLENTWEEHTNKTSLKTYEISESQQILDNNYRLFTENYIVIPQTVSETTSPVFTLVFEDQGTTKIKEFTPSDEWLSQNLYTYNITYINDDLEINTEIEKWNEINYEDLIQGDHYLNVSVRTLDLAQSNHFYYNSSYPVISVSDNAKFTDNNDFNLNKYFEININTSRIEIEHKENSFFPDDQFTIFLEGKDQTNKTLACLPVNIRTNGDGTIEIDGTFWAPGNLINNKGMLDIAPNANYTGLYFRWGSLVGLTGNNNKSFAYDWKYSIGYRPQEFTGELPHWKHVPYIDDPVSNVSDAFIHKYGNLGYNAQQGKGDPCRYMSNQAGWRKGKWRMPTKEEFSAIIFDRKIRKINGNWTQVGESFSNESATTGTLPIEDGWFIKVDESDNSIPSDDEFNPIKPPNGWVFYPASGDRSAYTGILSQLSKLGYYWTATTAEWNAAYRFQFSEQNINNNLGSFDGIAAGFGDAYPIRCVRDIKSK